MIQTMISIIVNTNMGVYYLRKKWKKNNFIYSIVLSLINATILSKI